MAWGRDRHERQLIQALTQVYVHEPVGVDELRKHLPFRYWKTIRLLDELIRNKVVNADHIGPDRLYSINDLSPID